MVGELTVTDMTYVLPLVNSAPVIVNVLPSLFPATVTADKLPLVSFYL